MTDEQIIKALECFKSEDCLGEKCPYYEQPGLCGKPMCSDVYDFIYRQKAEIERLTEEVEIKQLEKERYHNLWLMALDDKKSNSEAIKEFVNELEKRLTHYGIYSQYVKDTIMQVAKEMTEKNDKE